MKKFSLIILAGLMTMLTMFVGCTSTPYDTANIDTANKAIVMMTAEVRAANLLLQEIVRARLITADKAQTSLDKLRETTALLQQAKQAVALTGDPGAGTSDVEKATKILDFVLELLSGYVEQLPGPPSVPLTAPAKVSSFHTNSYQHEVWL